MIVKGRCQHETSALDLERELPGQIRAGGGRPQKGCFPGGKKSETDR